MLTHLSDGILVAVLGLMMMAEAKAIVHWRGHLPCV